MKIFFCVGNITLQQIYNFLQHMAKQLSTIYYSPKGYWRGKAAVTKLASAARVSQAETREWLKKQAVWQIYQPVPRHIPRPMLDEDRPNTVHQADLLYLP